MRAWWQLMALGLVTTLFRYRLESELRASSTTRTFADGGSKSVASLPRCQPPETDKAARQRLANKQRGIIKIPGALFLDNARAERHGDWWRVEVSHTKTYQNETERRQKNISSAWYHRRFVLSPNAFLLRRRRLHLAKGLKLFLISAVALQRADEKLSVSVLFVKKLFQ